MAPAEHTLQRHRIAQRETEKPKIFAGSRPPEQGAHDLRHGAHPRKDPKAFDLNRSASAWVGSRNSDVAASRAENKNDGSRAPPHPGSHIPPGFLSEGSGGT